MKLDWARVAGATAAAAYMTVVVSGDDLLRGDLGHVVGLLVSIAFIAIFFYRLAPGLQEAWALRAEIEGRHPMQPTPFRITGALLLAALFALTYFTVDRLLLPDRTRDAADAMRGFLAFLIPGYAIWPAVEKKLRGEQ